MFARSGIHLLVYVVLLLGLDQNRRGTSGQLSRSFLDSQGQNVSAAGELSVGAAVVVGLGLVGRVRVVGLGLVGRVRVVGLRKTRDQ